MPNEVVDVLKSIFHMQIGAMLFSAALQITCYVLGALGLYTIAKNRGLNHAWLSWLPFGDHWILGSISDQYQSVAHGKVQSRRKVLLFLQIGVTVLGGVVFAFLGKMLVDAIGMAIQYDSMGSFSEERMIEAFLTGTFRSLGFAVIMGIVSIVLTVFRYIAYYNLFKSCDPNNAVLYTVLAILIPVTLPFFVFFSRKKEGGMPPRRQIPQGTVYGQNGYGYQNPNGYQNGNGYQNPNGYQNGNGYQNPNGYQNGNSYQNPNGYQNGNDPQNPEDNPG